MVETMDGNVKAIPVIYPVKLEKA